MASMESKQLAAGRFGEEENEASVARPAKPAHHDEHKKDKKHHHHHRKHREAAAKPHMSTEPDLYREEGVTRSAVGPTVSAGPEFYPEDDEHHVAAMSKERVVSTDTAKRGTDSHGPQYYPDIGSTSKARPARRQDDGPQFHDPDSNVARLPSNEDDVKQSGKQWLHGGNDAIPGAVAMTGPADSLKPPPRRRWKATADRAVENDEEKQLPKEQRPQDERKRSSTDSSSDRTGTTEGRTSSAPRRTRPARREPVVGAVRVRGFDAPANDSDALDNLAVSVSEHGEEQTPVDSSLPVARPTKDDDSNEEFSDSLGRAEPLSPEDLKPKGVLGWIKQHRRLTAIAVLVVIGAIVGGVVGATVGGGSSVAQPTLAPTMMPSAAPTVAGFEQVVDTLSKITPTSVLTDPSTPQSAAVGWLLRDDEYGVNFNDEPKLLQRYALATVYFATNGANWTSQLNFLTNQDECLWNETVDDVSFGVTECNEQDLATKLSLSRNGLVGTLPNELVGMPFLYQFGAADNDLDGTIPTAVASLSDLVEVYLFDNRLSGSLPQGNFPKLTHLALQNNRLTGALPPSIGALTKLLNLYLSQNALSSSLPTTIGNLVTLEQLWINSNRFSGSVPSEVSKMTLLSTIWLQDNDFTGGMENFCTINFDRFSADCGVVDFEGVVEGEPEVECSCCTSCCLQGPNGGCVPNAPL